MPLASWSTLFIVSVHLEPWLGWSVQVLGLHDGNRTAVTLSKGLFIASKLILEALLGSYS